MYAFWNYKNRNNKLYRAYLRTRALCTCSTDSSCDKATREPGKARGKHSTTQWRDVVVVVLGDARIRATSVDLVRHSAEAFARVARVWPLSVKKLIAKRTNECKMSFPGFSGERELLGEGEGGSGQTSKILR